MNVDKCPKVEKHPTPVENLNDQVSRLKTELDQTLNRVNELGIALYGPDQDPGDVPKGVTEGGTVQGAIPVALQTVYECLATVREIEEGLAYLSRGGE